MIENIKVLKFIIDVNKFLIYFRINLIFIIKKKVLLCRISIEVFIFFC